MRRLILGLAAGLGLMAPAMARPAHPVRVVADGRITVATAAGQGVLPLYVSQDWSAPLPGITRAVLVIHGRLRNADVYLRSAQAAAVAAGPAAGALLVVPQFLDDADMAAWSLPANTLHWSAEGWMGGDPAHGAAKLSSFDALDAIMARLTDRTRFPNLQTIVVAGHSGGGQVVQRYAVLGQFAGAPGVTLRYVVANPSSYAYFDTQRPASGGGFAPFAAASCPGFDTWKYGLQALPPYARDEAPGTLEARYVMRPVTYLLGQLDTDPNHPALDKSCMAEAQGPFRLARGRAYFAYLSSRHPAGLAQAVVEVPGVGHDGNGMLTSPAGLAALFGP